MGDYLIHCESDNQSSKARQSIPVLEFNWSDRSRPTTKFVEVLRDYKTLCTFLRGEEERPLGATSKEAPLPP